MLTIWDYDICTIMGSKYTIKDGIYKQGFGYIQSRIEIYNERSGSIYMYNQGSSYYTSSLSDLHPACIIWRNQIGTTDLTMPLDLIQTSCYVLWKDGRRKY